MRSDLIRRKASRTGLDRPAMIDGDKKLVGRSFPRLTNMHHEQKNREPVFISLILILSITILTSFVVVVVNAIDAYTATCRTASLVPLA